jgi:hypothetical protein
MIVLIIIFLLFLIGGMATVLILQKPFSQPIVSIPPIPSQTSPPPVQPPIPAPPLSNTTYNCDENPPLTSNECLKLGNFDPDKWTCVDSDKDYPSTCALKLKIGNKLHFTVAYFNECPDIKDDIINNVINNLKTTFGNTAQLFIDINLENGLLTGWFVYSKCVSGKLAEIKHETMKFLNNNYNIQHDQWGTVPHSLVIYNNKCESPYDKIDVYDTKNWSWSTPRPSSKSNTC